MQTGIEPWAWQECCVALRPCSLERASLPDFCHVAQNGTCEVLLLWPALVTLIVFHRGVLGVTGKLLRRTVSRE